MKTTIAAMTVIMSTLLSSGACAAAPEIKAERFDIQDVQLLESPFTKMRNLDVAYMMSLEPDRFLHNFRKTAGLEPKGEIYGGWEARGVAGQGMGHYMTALAILHRSTGNPEAKRRLQYIVSELAEAQKKNGDGYVAAIPNGRSVFEPLKEGKVDASPWHLNGGWAPWYVIHKLMGGLRDAVQLAGVEEARPVLLGLANWSDETTKHLSEEKLEEMLGAEFGGMNEVLLDVYAMTGDKRYLEVADRFYHNTVLDPLEQGKNKLAGLHANTQIPKIVGEARRYELLGEARDRNIAEYFWHQVVNHHTYAMGGNSNREHFVEPGKLNHTLSPTSAETCNTYNMLRLTPFLFRWKPDGRYFDYYERALYNHIMASQEPTEGRFAYYVSLKPGHFRTYSTPHDSFWCCVDTGFENHVRYPENIYFHKGDDLFVNLYIPSKLEWKDRGVTVTMETDYPATETVRLTVETRAPARLELKFRVPGWAQQGYEIQVNGEKVGAGTIDGYATVSRIWRAGDIVELRLPMSLRKEAMPDNPGRLAIMYGPTLLAVPMGKEGMEPPMPFAAEQNAYFRVPSPAPPVLLAGDKPVEEWIEAVDLSKLEFKTKGVGHPEDFRLVPFAGLYHERYTAYIDNYTPDQWELKKTQLAAEQEEERRLDARTVDLVRPGEQQVEVDHDFKGEKSRTGDHGDRKWRDALPGGWFSYTVKADPAGSNTLQVMYWGSDDGKREFIISANGKKLATEKLTGEKPEAFFRRDYALPAEAIGEDGKVVVRFEGTPGNVAGGIFELRVLR